jgi:hypothetical protein
MWKRVNAGGGLALLGNTFLILVFSIKGVVVIMRRVINLTLFTLTALLFSMTTLAGKDGNGNGAPSGAHYTLNLIGVGDKDADMKGNKGHRIFVKLQGNTKIYLTEGDFQVLDANGTDRDGAIFQLPAADADCDGSSDYSVFVRELGTPGGGAVMTTCLYDKVTGEEYCSSESVTLTRSKGKPSFRNVSKQLLTVVYDVDGDGDLDRTPLFGDDSYGYLWDYENNGLRLAQLRFYDEFTLLDDGEYDYNCTP